MVTYTMRDGSGKITLRYVVEDPDRWGNVRIYVRPPGGKRKVRIRETPGTDAFMAAYRAALAGERPQGAKAGSAATEETAPEGSLRWLVKQYVASGEFRQLDPGTQKARRGVLEALCQQRDSKGALTGLKPYGDLEPRHVLKMRDAKAGTPGAANNLVKYLGYVFAWACHPARGLADKNPCRGLPKLRPARPDGHHTWTEEERAQYEARHAIGTKARLAYAILRFLALRRSDACRLGPQHVRPGPGGEMRVRMTLAKNARTRPVIIDVPMPPELAAVIAATPSAQDHLAYLVTPKGKPFTSNGLGNAMRAWCDQAGLPHCSAHGLRKAEATEAAEAGASERELMAALGWTDPAQARRYTERARSAKLADALHQRVQSARQAAAHRSAESVPPFPAMAEGGTKRGKNPK